MVILDKIVKAARSFQGEQEIRGNKGFKSKWFQNLMMQMGWKKYQAWCAYLAEAVWKEAYATYSADIVKELDKLFSASAVQTYKNFKKSSKWYISEIPVKGALAIWQTYKNGKPHWTGHIGVVEKIYSKPFITTIDGNTNYGKSREGFVVAPVQRKMNFKQNNGLRLLGFVYPNQIIGKENKLKSIREYEKVA